MIPPVLIFVVWLAGVALAIGGIRDGSLSATATGIAGAGVMKIAEAIFYPSVNHSPSVIVLVWLAIGAVACGYVAHTSRTSAGDSE